MQGTVKCPICGRPYKWYSHTVADQSACPDCVREANRRTVKPTDWEIDRYNRRRQRHFDGQ